MELSNSIAQMSMSMSEARLQQGLGISLMKKAMEMSETSVDAALQMLDSSPAVAFPGDVGAMFDVRA